ncbi:hypothetical protein AK812_SmicGene24097 [Symbiodinium microadriaticum]|uniref:Uncharacterized protein n=1 Tax=Symbiodinium microadriaticum TaxID=2951 RepID=A0A1Q9DFJ1_SYMMI|nr:hypothetical protein AK812_SmicGene24097 [Symbiodinium microadriaticum]
MDKGLQVWGELHRESLETVPATKREALADALFNQAYSSLMTIGNTEKNDKMQGADTTLQVKEEVDWNDLDQDVVVATPPFYNVDNQSERSCKDIQGEQGAQQPRTPEMLLDLRDVGGAEANPKTKVRKHPVGRKKIARHFVAAFHYALAESTY